MAAKTLIRKGLLGGQGLNAGHGLIAEMLVGRISSVIAELKNAKGSQPDRPDQLDARGLRPTKLLRILSKASERHAEALIWTLGPILRIAPRLGGYSPRERLIGAPVNLFKDSLKTCDHCRRHKGYS